MADRNWNWFGRAHRWVFEKTGGRVGGKLAGIPMLLLTTQGRRSGEWRTTPLAYMPDGDRCVVLGSNNGQDRHPAWWLNLQKNPSSKVQLRGRARDVLGRQATPEEHEALWPRMIETNPTWQRYPGRTRREIPVVVLEPR
jgi:deazaflavin-dependent oxidoreductase (nitroreductase family)